MNWDKPKSYAVKHKDTNVVNASRSGGVFTAISDYVLNLNGIVYGCILSDSNEAVHIRTDNASDRNLMRGSKYIQSKLGDTFILVRKDLDEGKLVLFSGTSCQVAGLLSFLGKSNDNLITLDIVCHGVPSPLVWQHYLKFQEKRNGSRVKKIDFRNKIDFGWRNHIETLWFENGVKNNSDIFKNIFYGHWILRPCCYECHYKSLKHPSDITIADYWGVENAAPEFDDNKGVSLVLINSDIGEHIFLKIGNSIIFKETDIEKSMQPPLKGPFDRPRDRDIFWNDFYNKRFSYISKKYGGDNFINKIKKKKRALKKVLLK